MKDEGRKKSKRAYAPVVEALEALRLLSVSSAATLPGLAAQHAPLSPPDLTGGPTLPPDAWDTALVQTRLADLLGPATAKTVDSADIDSGLWQLERYLSRAWYRAGIPPQQHDDSSQAVYVTLLQNWGSPRFEQMLGEIGQNGIRDVLSRETPNGPDFFRAVDTVKKRSQRERTFQPLESAETLTGTRDTGMAADWRGALQEAIDQSLNPREAALIYATLNGETPLEIASHWGIAPKTVSNEKTRVIQKLRDFLEHDLPD
ncbi:MAG TPA: sigma-70 family RNA polymerase sigma factor [Isosphaeraceae bacterium]|nr:sigma-70 family RNA polymerase sigma factor [Isosphaeraceae bacterium]